MGEKLLKLNIQRDGPLLASDFENFINQMAEPLVARFERLETEVRGLRKELDAERRLRLSGRGLK